MKNLGKNPLKGGSPPKDKKAILIRIESDFLILLYKCEILKVWRVWKIIEIEPKIMQ